MASNREEAWVTVLENDECLQETLVFLKSLQRTLTHRKIIVLGGPSVSDEIRNRVEKECHAFVNLFEIQGLSLKNSALLHCWSLTLLKKCVFIDSSLLIIRNCDDLFQVVEDTGVAIENTKLVDGPEPSIVLLSPSLDIYNNLVRKLKKIRSENETQSREDSNLFLKKWIICQNAFQTQKKRFRISINLENDSSTTVNREFIKPSVVQFVGKNPFELISKGETLIMPPGAGSFEKEIIEYSSLIHKEINEDTRPTSSVNDALEPIAVIGISGRFPGANSIDEFWTALITGEDGIKPVPNDRWTPEQSCVADDENRKIVEAGFLKCPVDKFDGKFFRMSNMELINTDPQQRLLLEVSWEALEDALIDPTSLKGTSTGIFTGLWTNDYKELMMESGFKGNEFYRAYMGNSFGPTTARLAHFYEIIGPTISTESGCSTSMVGVGIACKSLRSGDSNLALACGANLILRPFCHDDWKTAKSIDNRCKTFDSKANGYGRAEGCGVLVLKRLSDAVRDGDRIRAVIRGYGQTQEGLSYSMGTPTVHCESLAMKLALEDAQVEPKEVSYVEAHGTGTFVGDPMEMEAIQTVYSKDRIEPLVVGTVKTNMGHGEACAGIMGIVKTILSLEREIIPPNINFETLNPKINLEAIPAQLPLVPTPWERIEGKKRIAGVSSFGITGSDCHLIIEESPIIQKIQNLSQLSKEPARILTLSAKNEESLNDLIDSYKDYLNNYKTKGNKMNDLTDIAFTANTGRSHFRVRTAIVGQSCEEVIKKMEKRSYKINETQGERPKLCFLFTGQGSEYRLMGKTLYDSCPVFRENFDICDAKAFILYGFSIRDILWNGDRSAELATSSYAHLSIFIIEYSLVKLWESWGIKPDAVLGHSLGEAAAAVAAGIYSVDDGIRLVVERGRLLNKLPPGNMLVLRCDQQVAETCVQEVLLENQAADFWIDTSVINSPEQTVLSGPTKSIQKVEKLCKSKGIKTLLLNSPFAYHSRAIDLIADEYRTITSKVQFSKPTCTYISGMEGRKLDTIDSDLWVKQTRNPVKFLQACEEVGKMGHYIFLEVGPQPILSALVARNLQNLEPSSRLFSIRKNENEWTTMCNALGNLYVQGFDINWSEFHRYFSVEKVSLPFYQFQRSTHWFPPVTGIKQLLRQNGKQLHPLLGSRLKTASTSQTIFQSYLDFNQTAPYIKDHVVGNTIVFPGAGYIELCLAAAAAFMGQTVFDTEQPVIIENLEFKAILGIREDTLCEMQTIISKGLELHDNKVQVFKLQQNDEIAWVCHAECKINSMQESLKIDSKYFENNLESLKLKFKEELNTKEFYENQSNVNLNFGPCFKAIRNIWRNDQEILTRVEVPTDHNDYLCHPVVIDAMLQSTMCIAQQEEVRLQLPVSIKKFLFYKKSKSRVNYVHSIKKETETVSRHAELYDEDGELLACLVGAEFLPTSLETISKVLETQEQQQEISMIYEDVWKPQVQNLPTEEIISSSDDSYWIVLSDEGQLLENLTSHLQERGRRNIVNIRRGTQLERKSRNTFCIRPDIKADMEAAITTIRKNYSKQNLEGVIFLWGIKDVQEGPHVISLGLLHLIQTVINVSSKELPKIFVITQGAVYIGDQEPLNPTSGALWGLSRTFRSEHPHVQCRCIDTDPSIESYNALFSELWNIDEDYDVAYRDGVRFVPRIIPAEFPMKPLPIPSIINGRTSLILPASKSIADLKFGPLLKKPVLGNNIEIQVKVLGLNFKELMNVLKPDDRFANTNAVGMDFAGVVSEIGPNVTLYKVGDPVIGSGTKNGPLPSHITTDEGTVVHLPNDLTFAEGAAMSSTFLTVYFTLIVRGNLKRGETILIHTASGGIGIMAVQIAHYIGAEVIATAGSKRKRAFVRSSLGVKNVFDSRSVAFGEQIMNVTNGKGVDMILNSLTGPGMKETSLKVLRNGGRFVEMSKLNIWTPQEVSNLRFDVKYSAVELNSMVDAEGGNELLKTLHGHLRDFLNKKILHPMPVVPFDASNVRDALMYLQKAKHIGKVVVMMPEFESSNNNGQIKKLQSNLFNDRSTYLITGGLGGIGLKVAKWMANQGAKYIVLCGRNHPNDEALKTIKSLYESDKIIKVMLADVGSRNGCTKVLNAIKDPAVGLPPLRGIMHAAGCISDELLENQTKESFDVTFNAKVTGGWNFHLLTAKYNLEHFVLFSSISATFGGVKQSNYAAANSYLDSLAHYRQALGLPATTINWGQWEIGMASGMEITGITPFTSTQGLKALEKILRGGKTQSAVFLGDLKLWRMMYTWATKYLEELKSTADQSGKGKKTIDTDDVINPDKFWKDLDKADQPDSKQAVVRRSVSSVISCIMKSEGEGEIDRDQNFEELGLDSLMRIEMKNMLQMLLGKKVSLSISDISDCNTIQLLANRLLQLIYPTKDKSALREARNQLVRDDCILPSHIKSSKICEIKPSEIRVVLVTGVTGNLGPYVLENLAGRSQLSKIYCIIRPKKSEDARQRLIKCLKDKCFPVETCMNKVIVIEGNVTETNLGISSHELYESLSQEVDAVINIAVKSSYLEEYHKSEGNLTDTRTVNVIGTHRVLEFAMAKKTKWVYQASSLLAAINAGEDGLLPETWPLPGDFDNSANFGYAISKYISDRLMAQAVDVGIPCKVFRFALISGESRTGRQTMKDSHFFVKYMYYFKSGVLPNMPIPLQIMPVDVSASISLDVFFNDDAPSGVYNCSNPHNNTELELNSLSKEFGYSVPLKPVEYPEFVNTILKDGKDSLLYTMTEFYSDEERYLKYILKVLETYEKNPEKFYFSKKLTTFIPNFTSVVEPPLEILRRDLRFAKESGAF